MKIRVLVVDDSAVMRSLIGRIIQSDTGLELAGTASNGIEAVDKARQLKPDVITMDVEMPQMNGLEALNLIMKSVPTPVIMLSSLTQYGARETMAALEDGAIDFVQKPSGAVSIDLYKIQLELQEKIRVAAQAKNYIRRTRHQSGGQAHIRMPPARTFSDKPIRQLIAIGASTGGPQALADILSRLPGDFAHPILIVQHMPPKFTTSLAQRLNTLSALRVVEASHEEPLRNGTVYLAPGDYHMTIGQREGQLTIGLHQEPRNGWHRPSVDELFASVSSLPHLKTHYVILTGMGKDGSRQLSLAKQAGAASTIAEDHTSCIVFGMPKAAIETGAVDYIVPLDRIPAMLVEVTGRHAY